MCEGFQKNSQARGSVSVGLSAKNKLASALPRAGKGQERSVQGKGHWRILGSLRDS
jgi:hypothetical protein